MKLKEAIPNPVTEGILRKIASEDVSLTWITSPDNDLDYNARSDEKTVSPLVEKLMAVYHEDTLTGNALKMAADIIIGRYGTSWAHLWGIMAAEYEPIENYNMKQTETPDITRATNYDQTITDTGSRDGSVFGFNSVQSVPQTSEANGNTRTIAGEDTTNYETETGTRKLERAGNIGVMTVQSMLTEEKDFWKWTVWEQIFEDIDKVLCCPVYE